MPEGRETDASYFPKASETDEDLKLISQDNKDLEKEGG